VGFLSGSPSSVDCVIPDIRIFLVGVRIFLTPHTRTHAGVLRNRLNLLNFMKTGRYSSHQLSAMRRTVDVSPPMRRMQ
jgi:hypothetical protein